MNNFSFHFFFFPSFCFLSFENFSLFLFFDILYILHRVSLYYCTVYCSLKRFMMERFRYAGFCMEIMVYVEFEERNSINWIEENIFEADWGNSFYEIMKIKFSWYYIKRSVRPSNRQQFLFYITQVFVP